MFRTIIIVVSFLSISLLCKGQTNRALFVAIDKYMPESGWNDIHATNDAKLVIPMLTQKGFRKGNIISLMNDEATKTAIVRELKYICNKSRKGDYIYIHFSCHGQQMIDDNGDEEDGLDEALIPYDAQRRFTKGVYEGKNHLRDDELELFLNKIRARVGVSGNVTLVIDACHSGTANRDTDNDLYARGTTYVFAPYNYIAPAQRAENKKMMKLESAPDLADINVFSACQSNQINYEYFNPSDKIYYGALSYAISKVVSENEQTVLSFQNKIEELIILMFSNRKIKQIPYLETTDENKRFKIGQ